LSAIARRRLLPDPPRRVSRELGSCTNFDALINPMFLDEVQRDAALAYFFGDGDDEPQVRPCRGPGLQVAVPIAFGEVNPGLGEEWVCRSRPGTSDGVAGVARVLEVAVFSMSWRLRPRWVSLRKSRRRPPDAALAQQVSRLAGSRLSVERSTLEEVQDLP